MSQSDFAVSSDSPVPHKKKKLFTLAEAQRALPLVKRVAADIQTTQALRLKIHAELSAGLSDLSPGRQNILQGDFDRATDRLEKLIDELAAIGVELKDPRRALLDFPALHEGRVVLLCWKADEDTITHWHEIEAGYAGRKPVALPSRVGATPFTSSPISLPPAPADPAHRVFAGENSHPETRAGRQTVSHQC